MLLLVVVLVWPHNKEHARRPVIWQKEHIRELAFSIVPHKQLSFLTIN
jgi:hypothetical protein